MASSARASAHVAVSAASDAASGVEPPFRSGSLGGAPILAYPGGPSGPRLLPVPVALADCGRRAGLPLSQVHAVRLQLKDLAHHGLVLSGLAMYLSIPLSPPASWSRLARGAVRAFARGESPVGISGTIFAAPRRSGHCPARRALTNSLRLAARAITRPKALSAARGDWCRC